MRNDPSQYRVRAFFPSLVRLLGLLRVAKFAVIVSVLLSLVAMALTVAVPGVLGAITDMLYTGARDGNIDFLELNRLIAVIIGCYFAASAFDWFSGWLFNRAIMRVIYRLRADIEAKVNNLELSYFDTNKRGDIISRVTNDVDNIQTSLQQGFATIVGAVAQLLAVTVIMFVLSWQLALITVLSLPLTAVLIGFVGSRSQKLFRRQWAATGEVNGVIEESFTGHEIIRAFGREEQMAAAFSLHNAELRTAAIRSQALSGMIFPATQFVGYFIYVLIAIVGALKVLAGQLSVGTIVAFIKYSSQFAEPMGQLARTVGMVQSGVASAERTFELLDAPERAVDAELSDFTAAGGGAVEFRDVSFGYDPATPLIKGLSLTAEPGQTVAIVGPTGAGKTTIVNLLMRFYEIDSGSICVDGVDISDISVYQLRRRVGMVLQDAYLFNGTIRENIRYGRLSATDAEVEAAAKATMVDHFVRLLPDGYDTVLEENGSVLSVGERQLITIARAFLADPEILVLDEATSSVDTRTEVLVQRAMSELRAGRTAFVIAHRLSTVRDADQIVMLDAGRVVDRGTHSEMLECGGPYAELVAAQYEV